MVDSNFLRVFAAVAALLGVLIVAFTLIIDPYGVSPIGARWDGINRQKPARINIDRLIKPYEVWRYQPKTIFLGTSRTHEGLNSEDLDGTRFAPAYNASIPGSSLSLTSEQLRQYVVINPSLRTVVLELFFYQFIGMEPPRKPAFTYPGKPAFDLIGSALRLFLTIDTVNASFQTLNHNIRSRPPGLEIAPEGHLVFPPDHTAKGNFDGFPDGIWRPQNSREELFPILNEWAFKDLAEVIEVCRRNRLELILVMLPNHAYDDYRLEDTGQWPNVAEWLRRLAGGNTLYSFAQPNEMLYESVAVHMKYWVDPIHMNLELGKHVLATLAGGRRSDTPDRFMMRIEPDAVAAHVEERSNAIRRWAAEHQDFVDRFGEARRKWEARLEKK